MEERFIGLEVYLTKGKGIGGKLKRSPDDFIVEEIPLHITRKSNGKNTIIKVRLRNWETNRFVMKLARELNIDRNSIFYAGTKDKRAITTQYFCIRNFDREIRTSLKDAEIIEVFRTDECLDLGDLYGNSFKIVVSDAEDGERVKGILDELSPHMQFPNFFGVQRFGSSRPVTHIVGKFIIQGRFDEAVRHYIGLTFDHDRDAEARRYFFETLDPEGTLNLAKGKMDYEYILLKHLLEKPGDYAGAISRLPRNLRMMFVHGYQGYLFNKILSARIRLYSPLKPMVGDVVLPVDSMGLPNNDRHIYVTNENIETIERKILERKAYISGILFGSESRFAGGEMGEIERGIIEAEGISENMFRIREIRDISSKGSRRSLTAPFLDFSFSESKNDIYFEFKLFRGCYATSLLREFMKRDDLGFY
ncbi:MAG: tRNA pseudouridine(13) synthase TruD [Thermoplasmata archaeon]